MTAERRSFFATCAPGIEPVLHGEVRELGLARSESQVGGVYFEGTLADARRANLWLRTAVRVLMRVGRFEARDAEELYAGVGAVDWSEYIGSEARLVVDAQSNRSALEHTRFVEQRTKDAIVDQLRTRGGTRPSVDRDDADLGVHVHLFRDRCTLSVDTSGRALHRRGWRRSQGEAPLAETLAAALVLMSGWDRRAPFLDPFCGSGTLAIEAALVATDTAPGLFREFGFERWRGHDARAFEREKQEARSRRSPIGKRTILGTDVDREQLSGARANLAGAELEGAVHFERADAREFAPRAGWNGWVVSNLPYGKRVGGGGDLFELYRAFGDALRERARGFTYGLLVPDEPVQRELRLQRARSESVVNGGIACRFLTGRIDA
ncbi:MAG: THUMP domain-containing protein [Planctomycetota bacterium]